MGAWWQRCVIFLMYMYVLKNSVEQKKRKIREGSKVSSFR